MVSIRQSLTELETAHRMGEVAFQCYEDSVRSAAQYLIEISEDITPPYRRQMEALAARVSGERSEAALAETRALLRQTLREYRDEASAYLNQLQEDLAAKAESLQRIFESMAAGDGDHELRLNRTMRDLRELSATPDAARVRTSLVKAANSLDESLQELKRHHQLTVAQFLTEIQMLHQRIQCLESSAALDRVTRLANREELEARLEPAIATGASHFLIVLNVRNLSMLKRQFGEGLEEGLLSAFAKRLRNCIQPDDLAARWSDDQFAVLQACDMVESRAACRRASEHVGGVYVFTHEGRLIRPVLHVDVAAVELRSDDTVSRISQRIAEFHRSRP